MFRLNYAPVALPTKNGKNSQYDYCGSFFR